MRGLEQIRAMNEQATRVHLAIEVGILAPGTPYDYQFTVQQYAAFERNEYCIRRFKELTQ